jgi:Na+:H+ antiporter, NhaA family
VSKPRFVSLLQEFSIPLIAGVFVALAWANLAPRSYAELLQLEPFGDLKAFGHPVTLHFLVNDLFMVFFFGIAAKEITEACLPGGNLNPLRKALNPLLATLGGVVGPVIVFFVVVRLFAGLGAFGEAPDLELLHKGWGIPTATDIALAWLVARAVFGAGHPAIDFLLLLAVADDGVGLVIIALFYGDPTHPAQPAWLLLCVAGVAMALALRGLGVRSWIPYVALGGPLAWTGLMLARLHPALALVCIVPCMPGPKRDTGLFAADAAPSTLRDFSHSLKLFVDLGLFFFAFTNAGVEFAGIGAMTWTILIALVVGKTAGITLLGLLAVKLGFPLPDRMGLEQLVMAGFVAALGLTVALFVAGAAFGKLDADLEGQAKMGALLSGFVGLVAVTLGRLLKLRGKG